MSKVGKELFQTLSPLPMDAYPLTVLVLGGMAACIGLEVLGLYLYTRRRLYAWLGLLGTIVGLYCYFSFRLYSVDSLAEGARWQFWQLVTSSVMFDVAILLGLEYLTILGKGHLHALMVLTLLTAGPMWIPGWGLTDQPAVKEVPWLGIRYLEMELGPSPTAFYLVGVVWMGYVAVKLVQRSLRGTRQDRIMTGAYLLWWGAAANDMLVSSRVYSSVYLVEFAFFLIVMGAAALLLGAEHYRGQVAERERLLLAREVISKNRDLARAHIELSEAARLAAVGQLAAGVAHEVNNPLAYILSNLQLLELDLEDRPAQLELVREALEGTDRIRRVVQQLSSFSRSSTSSRAGQVSVAAASAIKMAMVKLKDRARIELCIPELPPVQMDGSQLAQILLNLLINAAQSIAAGNRDDNRVMVAARAQGERIEIMVEDTGSGISPDALPHIFEPFYTTKAIGEGQGLGLAISRELVQTAGGRIAVENVVPHGARFILSLPVHVESTPPPSADSSSEPSSDAPEPWDLRRLRLLIVDDDREVARALKRTLQRCFEVQTAHSGRDALRLLGADHGFDIVLCDLMMPDGSGLDVVQGISRQCPALLARLVLMTGAAPDGNREQVYGNRSFPLLSKPFGLPELQSLVRILLKNTSASEETVVR